MSGEEGSGEGRNVVKLDDLSIEQLTRLQKQFEQEIEFFGESVKQLKIAHSKYNNSGEAAAKLREAKSGDSTLIPLSESMYIRATLSDPDAMLVDIGTGYYAEMTAEKAQDYFQRKSKYLTNQIENVEKLHRDTQTSRMRVTEKLQAKIRVSLAAQQQQQ